MPPPSKRAKVVRPTSIQTDYSGYDYPTEDEINEPPDSLDGYIRCFFGRKGVGKSTLVSQFPNAFTWMYEPRRRNLRIRQMNLQKQLAKDIISGADDVWERMKQTTPRIIDDESIQTVNYDSIDLAYETCYHSICAKHGVESPAGAGKSSADVWIEIRDEWSAFFDLLAASRLSINFVSHMKVRDSEELDGGKYEKRSPSCSPACLLYIKQACDFVWFYGTINGKRALQLRDNVGQAEVATGTEGRFLQPNGKPIIMLPMPELSDKETGYQRLVKAFNNECWDIDTPDEEKAPTKKGPPKPPRR